MDKTKIIIIIIVVAVAVAIFGLWWWQNSAPGKLDAFAQCIANSGAKFYGAYWCSHCQKQKAMFGSSQKHLPYIECSTPDGRGQLALCSEANVASYPTWEFADGSRETGELSLQRLVEKTSCQLP